MTKSLDGNDPYKPEQFFKQKKLGDDFDDAFKKLEQELKQKYGEIKLTKKGMKGNIYLIEINKYNSTFNTVGIDEKGFLYEYVPARY